MREFKSRPRLMGICVAAPDELSKIRPRSADRDTTTCSLYGPLKWLRGWGRRSLLRHYRKEKRLIDGIIFVENLLHCGRRTGRNDAGIFAGARRNRGPDSGEAR